MSDTGKERRWTLIGRVLGPPGNETRTVDVLTGMDGPLIPQHQQVEVMPVSEHEAALEAEREKGQEADIWREIHLRRLKDVEALLSTCPDCEGDYSGGPPDEPAVNCSRCGNLGLVVPEAALTRARKEGREEVREAASRQHRGEAGCGWCKGEGAILDPTGKLGADCPRCAGRTWLVSTDSPLNDPSDSLTKEGD